VIRSHTMRAQTASWWGSAAGVAAAAIVVLAGCGGQGNTPVSASLTDMPLAPGAKVVWSQRRCDAGVRSYCSVQFVLTGPRYPSSAALRNAQLAVLKRAGWGSAHGQTDAERATQSPHGNLRVTYATAFNDLLSLDQGTIERAPGVGRSLARQLFSQTPALSGVLQTGIS
jgi:hypothetical protein